MNPTHSAPSFFVQLGKMLIPRAIRPSQFLGPQIRAKTGRRVYSGPYQGMHFLEHSYWNLYYPKLLGTYEKELNPFVEEFIAQKPPLIINVGAGEGYFAVGMARRLPKAKILAFEATSSERERLAKMCELNGVSGQIEIRGKCELPLLDDAMRLSPNPYVICDVEGYEDQLLVPDKLSNARQATFMVEVHEFTKSSLRKDLLDRFAPTHDCRVISPLKRRVDEYPFRSGIAMFLPSRFLTGTMNEFRPREMCWMVMHPKKEA